MKKLLLSLNNCLLISLSILIGLFLFTVIKNQQHNKYIIDLNQRAPSIAKEIVKSSAKEVKDYLYSIYSTKHKKNISSTISNEENNDPRIRFNYSIPINNDVLIVSIYEKEIKYKYLIFITCYIIIVTYIIGFIILYIVERKNYLLQQVEKLNSFDSLTGLYNQVKFTQSIEKQIQNKLPFYVVVTDIEDFKRINQLSGYEVGDLLLKNYAVGLKLKKMIKNPARISGNQFIFYINEDEIGNKDIHEVLKNMIDEIYIINDETYKIKQNIGYVKYPDNSCKTEELIKFAEIAMHEAKISKTIELYQDIILEKLNKNNLIKRELPYALDKNEIFLVYQPKINIDNDIIYAEVLVRWQSKKLGFISPDIFIEVAEQTGEIYKLGKWIFEQAIKEISRYNKLGQYINLSVNLSPRQLLNKNIYTDFIQIIEENKVNAEQVTLELTESVMLDKNENFDLLTKFSDYGIKISIDDFGKGYSCFSYLKDFPINEIKLDKNFIDEVEKPFNTHLIDSIASLSKKLNISLIVEGVEKEEQVEQLKNLGCYFFQGYYYSKPLSESDFNIYINKKLDL